MRPELEQSRVLYDSIALTLAVGAPLVLLPLLPLTFFTALAACYLAIRYWKSPGSRTSRWKWRAPAAFVLGLGQVGLWLLGGAYLWTELWPLLRQ